MTDLLLYRLNRVPDRHYVKFLELIGVSAVPADGRQRRGHVLAVGAATDRLTITTGTQVATLADSDRGVDQVHDDRTTGHRPVRCRARRQFARLPTASSATTTEARARRPAVLLLRRCAPARRRAVRRAVRGRAALRRDAAVRLPDRGHRRRPDRPAARLGGVDRRRLASAATSSVDSTRRAQPGRRRRDPRPEHARRLGDRSSAGRLGPRPGARSRARASRRTRASPQDRRRCRASRRRGTADAVNAEIVTNEVVGVSEGVPGPAVPAQAGTGRTRPGRGRSTCAVGEGWQEWRAVTTFAESGAEDTHFQLDATAGEVIFGPAVRLADGALRAYGAVPPKGAALRVRGLPHRRRPAGQRRRRRDHDPAFVDPDRRPAS